MFYFYLAGAPYSFFMLFVQNKVRRFTFLFLTVVHFCNDLCVICFSVHTLEMHNTLTTAGHHRLSLMRHPMGMQLGLFHFTGMIMLSACLSVSVWCWGLWPNGIFYGKMPKLSEQLNWKVNAVLGMRFYNFQSPTPIISPKLVTCKIACVFQTTVCSYTVRCLNKQKVWLALSAIAGLMFIFAAVDIFLHPVTKLLA